VPRSCPGQAGRPAPIDSSGRRAARIVTPTLRHMQAPGVEIRRSSSSMPFRSRPFEDGYENSAFHDFVGRLDKWPGQVEDGYVPDTACRSPARFIAGRHTVYGRGNYPAKYGAASNGQVPEARR
jgi:hypothetical protein